MSLSPLFFVALFGAVPLASPAPDASPSARVLEQHDSDPKPVEAALAELDAAYKDGKPETIVAAIKKHTGVVDAQVIGAIAKGLKRPDASVQSAAIDALGHMAHPDALEALHKYYAAEKRRLRDDKTLLPLLLKSIARNGNEASVAILEDDPFAQVEYATLQARFLGLGKIHSRKSVEALFGMLVKAGPRSDSHIGEMRPALIRLTGVDNGPTARLWQQWWTENKQTWKLPPEPAPLPEGMAHMWNNYWGEAREPQRGKQPPNK